MTLPANSNGAIAGENAPQQQRRRDGRRWLVLLVEDEHDLSEAMRGVLEGEGYEVVAVENGNAALKWLRGGGSPDLIILDLRMPIMDGWEFRAQQKQDPRLKSIPLIACSADASPQALAISADAYLKKPIDASLLVATVARCLHEHELKQMSQRLESAERLASLGRLAAAVGHEINNPLAFVMMNVSMAQKRMAALRARPTDSAGPEEPALGDIVGMLAESEVGLERIRQTVARLQKLSRDVQRRREPFELQATIDQSIEIVRSQIQHRARLIKDYRRRATMVNGDAVAVGQVFLNLIVNAAQAIPDGAADQNEIAITIDLVGDEILVEIRDTGSGIAPENLAHIFEPFFTTKPMGAGTGLGLAIARQTITDHHGRITFHSAPGQGTTVRVFLPFSSDLNPTSPGGPEPGAGAGIPTEIAPQKTGALGHRGRVMVIDDEPLIGSVIRTALKDENDVVIEVRAADALARLERGETFHLILCDMAMPNLGGPDVFAIVSSRWPALVPRLVFMTGGSFSAATRAFLDNTKAAVIAKPFTLEEIRSLARARNAAFGEDDGGAGDLT